jgi:hypothetical protein
MKPVYLRKHEYGCLVEALRRRQRFNDLNKSVTDQWTGLGCKGEYKQAVEAGYMKVATSLNPGHQTWWKLTEKGARVVCYWFGLGFGYSKIEAGAMPPVMIPWEVL